MASDWEEVRRLANDFQRVQQGSTTQRLSERNCIEIVSNLMKMKLLDVVFTTDGKEYLTPQHLNREIRDEIVVSGGRINIVDVAQALNVDLSHVEGAVKDIVRSDPSLNFILGQLINADYIASLADDMNERLQEKGVINISDLTIVFDLPAEFLMTVAADNLGRRIHGQKDPNNPRIILTDWLIARHRAVLRGALNASSRPVPIQGLIKQHNLNDRITALVVEELVSLGEVSGTLSGQGRKDKASFVPNVYSNAQNTWVKDFLSSNAYVAYDMLKRFDIADPIHFLKSRYATSDFMFLNTCMIPNSTFARVEGVLEDFMSTGTWMEGVGLFPSGMDEEDVAALLQKLMSSKKFKDIQLLEGNFLVANKMIDDCRDLYGPRIETVADQEATTQAAILMAAPAKAAHQEDDDVDSNVSSKKSRKDQRKQPTAKVASKGGKGKKVDDVEGSQDVALPDFLTIPAIVVEMQKIYEDAPYELLKAIADLIQPGLSSQYRKVLDAKAKTIIASSAVDRKQTHKTVQDQISMNMWLMRLFCKGIEHLSTDADKKQLSKHLLRNLGSEILNPLVYYVMEDLGMPAQEKTATTSESRNKLIAKLPEPYRSLFDKCNTASNGDSIDTFETALNALLDSEAIGMPVKKADKKLESQICQEHRQQLLHGIKSAKDVGSALRLCVLALFLKFTGVPLDAPGKFVPQMINIIKSNLNTEQLDILENCKEKMQSQPSQDVLLETIDKLHQIANG
ncbi:E3 UFM1-protein ligase 1-like [Paramacrobiotus metropolitanus]|uniref:E3 UFM1-protein ligase 1-like n=1 Tax=Paramacrobiotus metropolitanus TaxID=2943436 RepID=UPI0024456B9A|nr:E3 UFM1-protein ligase 1-like [Paramacrobiotus metropolitanus]